MPKALGGAGGEATNPEQLFAAGYAACFDSALQLVIRTKRVKVESTEVTAHVSIGKDTDGGFGLSAVLDVHVAGVSHSEAQELVEAAHGVCPYSKATRGNIEVTLNVRCVKKTRDIRHAFLFCKFMNCFPCFFFPKSCFRRE